VPLHPSRVSAPQPPAIYSHLVPLRCNIKILHIDINNLREKRTSHNRHYGKWERSHVRDTVIFPVPRM
jgi:hypothetical protein